MPARTYNRTDSRAASAFGRRAQPLSAASRSRPAASFETRYTWRVNWMALGLLIMAAASARDLFQPGPSSMKLIPLTSFDPLLMWLGTLGIGLVAVVWLWQGFARAPALTMNITGVSGFTLFGTKTIPWKEIDRLRLTRHDTYGTELQIHARRGTPSSSIWLNCIPIYVDTVDASLDEIIAAINVYRPDLSP